MISNTTTKSINLKTLCCQDLPELVSSKLYKQNSNLGVFLKFLFLFFIFIFCHRAWYRGPQLPNQGQNPCTCSGSQESEPQGHQGNPRPQCVESRMGARELQMEKRQRQSSGKARLQQMRKGTQTRTLTQASYPFLGSAFQERNQARACSPAKAKEKKAFPDNRQKVELLN